MEEEEEDDETDGSDEDECGVAVSMTSPEEMEDPEGKRNSMSPCLILSRLRVLFWERISPVLLRFRYTENPLELNPNSCATFLRKAEAVSLLVEGIFLIPSGDCTLMIILSAMLLRRVLPLYFEIDNKCSIDAAINCLYVNETPSHNSNTGCSKH